MGSAAQPSAGGLGPYPPRAAARRPSSGSSDAQSLASSSSEQLAARERRAARKVQREAMALRMTRAVLAPELRRMFVLRQSLKRWQSLKRCNAQRALLLFAQHEDATTALADRLHPLEVVVGGTGKEVKKQVPLGDKVVWICEDQDVEDQTNKLLQITRTFTSHISTMRGMHLAYPTPI